MNKLNKIGVQLFTVGAFMKTEEDIKRTFEKLKKLGYDEAQTAGMPCSYDVFAKLAQEAGIDIVGTHEDFDKLIADPETTMNNHKILNTDGYWNRQVFGRILKRAILILLTRLMNLQIQFLKGDLLSVIITIALSLIVLKTVLSRLICLSINWTLLRSALFLIHIGCSRHGAGCSAFD